MPDTQKIQHESAQIINLVKDLHVVTKDQYIEAGERLKQIKSAQKQVVDLFRESKKKASDAHKAICAAEKKLLTPLKSAEDACTYQVKLFLSAERKRKEEEQRRLQLEAEKQAKEEAERLKKEREEEQLKMAEMFESQGMTEEANEVLNTPIQSTPVIVPVVAPRAQDIEKIDGVHSRKNYKAEVVDLMLLVQEVAAGRQPLALLEPNTKKLNQLAKSLEAELRIPGVRVFNDESIVTKVV